MGRLWSLFVWLALAMYIGICAFLINADQVFDGLGMLALAIPMYWMLESPLPSGQHPDGITADQDGERVPRQVLAAFGFGAIFLVLAFVSLPRH